jgi:hypothetical protein
VNIICLTLLECLMVLKVAVERVTLYHILKFWVHVLAWEPAILTEAVSGFPQLSRQILTYCLTLGP